MISLNKSILIVLCILLGLAVGCGSGNKIKVSGHATFSDDDSPLTAGTVVLESETTRVMGELNNKGYFALGELRDGDGVPLGQYRVTISGAREQLPNGFPGKYFVDSKYERPDTSGLTFEAKKGGPNTFDIKVDRPANP